MQNKNIIVGLEIGTSNIRLVVADGFDDDNTLKVIEAVSSPSAGVRRGSVIDVGDAAKSIIEAVSILEKIIGYQIKDVILGVGGTEIKSQNAKGVIAIGRADGKIKENDIDRVLDSAQSAFMPLNSEIIHTIPVKYKLDDQSEIKNPIDMHGIRLEADVLMIEDSVGHLGNLIKSAEQAGLQVSGIVANSLAAATAVLSKNQKELGVVVVDIGGGTTTLAVFEEGELIEIKTLPIGAGHITNDIAIGLRVPIEIAEKVKLKYGSAFPREISKRDMIDLSVFNSQEEGVVSRYHVAEIIEARLGEIFDMVNAELSKIGKAGLLPAGAVLTGGGAEIPNIVNFAKDILRLPIRVGCPIGVNGVVNKIDSPLFATVVGLLGFIRDNFSKKNFSKKNNMLGFLSGILLNFFNTEKIGGAKSFIGKIINKFLP